MLASLFLRREKKSASEPALGSYLRPPDRAASTCVYNGLGPRVGTIPAAASFPRSTQEARRPDPIRSHHEHNGALR